MKKLLSVSIIFACFITACLLAACTKEQAPAEPEQPPVEQPAEPEPEPEPELIYHPLTGLPVETLPSGRVYVVSIDNNPDARMQCGSAKADIVYEVPAEGAIPRLIFLYYGSECDNIGPVRSARPYIVDVARGWHGVFVHCGWSEAAKSYLYSGVVDYINEISNANTFWRDHDRYAPHNLFTSSELLQKWVSDAGKDAEQSEPMTWMQFYADGEKPDSAEADANYVHIDFPYADNEYLYDAATNSYARYLDGQPYIDANTGQQIYASNIIMQRVKSYVLDDVGRLKIDMCAGGMAILFTGGKQIPGVWRRDTLDTNTKFYDAAGDEFILTPGQTWIEVCDGNVDVSWEQHLNNN